MSEVARGNLLDLRSRLMRSLALVVCALVLIIVALSLSFAALAVALATWIGIVPALLSIAAVAAILAMILMLILALSGRAKPSARLALQNLNGKKLPVGPVTVVLGALAVGLMLGRKNG